MHDTDNTDNTDNTRRLAGRVSVDGRWYGPGPVPDHIAEKITNPKAWAKPVSQETADTLDQEPGTESGARLASMVSVDGRWYGPDTAVPDHIAEKITNPKAWAGGTLPTAYDNGGALPAGVGKLTNNGPDAELVLPGEQTDSSGGSGTGAPPESPESPGGDSGGGAEPKAKAPARKAAGKQA